ncbi:adenylosuccinate lyase family protein [Rhodobacterales bacterium HKCCE2091]|nr:adenylosuccinate lyase family protein [Rhodobacterales bacterium HKCCE2091]
MSGSAFDSAIYRGLFTHPDLARLFTDSAEIRAMLLVEGALAQVQGRLGLIPETAAAAIHRAAMEASIDPAALTAETGRNGVPIPALVAAFRAEIGAPEHAQFLHWGATSQDIVDTALMLRMRRALEIMETDCRRLLKGLAALARDHAETPMAARTYGQYAAPSTFGAVAAGWGAPLLRHLDRLAELRPRVLCVSLSGAAGTGSAFGPDAPAIRAGLAEALGLSDSGASWHAARDRIVELGGWMAAAAGLTAKMGRDMERLCQSGIGGLRLGAGGGSSTMPQKQNPVGPSVLMALAPYAAAQAQVLTAALSPAEQRDGGAWFAEWLSFSPLVLAAGRALALAAELSEIAEPVPEALAAALDDPLGLIDAEAWSFALAERMPRQEAQGAVKDLCREAQATGANLSDLVARDHPGVALSPANRFGQAPADARAFAEAVDALPAGR